MSCQINILPRAERDFLEILCYLEERSRSGALRWRQAFRSATERIVTNPAQFGLAPENELAELTIQECFFRTKKGLRYRAVFTVVDEMVLVLRIRGPGQPPLQTDEMIS